VFKMASMQSERMSKEDWKKKNELDELRKSGAIEPEKDEEGNEINPHIPQYMSQAPWYLNAKGPGLKHQRNLKIQSVAQGQAARTVQAVGKSKLISRTRDEFGERLETKKKGTAQIPKSIPYSDFYTVYVLGSDISEFLPRRLAPRRGPTATTPHTRASATGGTATKPSSTCV